MSAKVIGPWPIRGRAEDAVAALNRALATHADRGTPVPCTGDDRWISDDRDVLATVARECLPCPVLSLCHEAALTLRPTAGVWAAVDWTHRPREARPA